MICANNKFTKKIIATTMSVLLIGSCSHQAREEDDPLKHSKKLIREGHVSLYDNGAFEVAYTELKIIPAAEQPLTIAKELAGIRARQAFLKSVNNAAESIYIIPAGSRLSVDIAKNISHASSKTGDSITDITRGSGTFIIKRSADFGKDMLLDSWHFGKETARDIKFYGDVLIEKSSEGGNKVAKDMTTLGQSSIHHSYEKAKNISTQSSAASKKSLHNAGNLFIKGYAATPEKLATRKQNMADAVRVENFSQGITDSNEVRQKYSAVFTNLSGDTLRNYRGDVASSFQNARDAFKENVNETGFGLALLKSSRWVLQGTLWDGLIEPIAKLGTASVGYVSVNMLAYPVMVVTREGVAVTTLAVEVAWNSGGAVYDVIAPSASSAVASVYSLMQITGGKLAAGATATGGGILGASEIATGQVVGNSIKGVGYVSGKATQYIGVPLTAAGVTLGAGSVGVVAGTAGGVTGSVLYVSGEATSITTKTFGNIIAGTTVVAGTTASVVAGTTVGVYELSKAVVVPAGYELGGGIVLGYGTTSQLAAHSILAVADASYLVLSLEGPRWVIYSVKGNLGNGDDLPPGTVLDLKTMQQHGEEFMYLPVSDDEMKTVVNGVYEDMPEAINIQPMPTTGRL